MDTKGVKMTNAVLPHSDRLKTPAVQGMGVPVALVLAVWFLIVYLLGAGEVFVTSGGTPPLALLITLTTPIIVFLAAFWISDPFREFVLAADLHLMTGIQAWRIPSRCSGYWTWSSPLAWGR